MLTCVKVKLLEYKTMFLSVLLISSVHTLFEQIFLIISYLFIVTVFLKRGSTFSKPNQSNYIYSLCDFVQNSLDDENISI